MYAVHLLNKKNNILIIIAALQVLFWDGLCYGDGVFQSGDAEVDAEEAIFVELIQTLLKDPAEREHFYQARQLHMWPDCPFKESVTLFVTALCRGWVFD